MKTKELTIEEKAKSYDEVLERAKELLEVGLKDTRDKRVVLSFFPELAKSEDERIREKVIATIHLYYGEPLEDETKEMIDWLEKQGEQTAEWSKEDKRNFDIIYGIIYNSCNAEDASRLIAWLKSLKDRDYQGKVDALNDTISSLNTLEGKEVDWDFMLHEYWDISPKICVDSLESATMTKDEMINFAKHFFELGLKAQKAE